MCGVVPLLMCCYSYDTGQSVCFDTGSSMRLAEVFGLDKTRLNGAPWGSGWSEESRVWVYDHQ